MKNKTKLVLGLAALTAVTAGVATTSTLAWFTTSRNATVTFTSGGVYSNNGDLQMKYIDADASSASDDTTFKTGGITVAGVTGAGTTDVSLDANGTSAIFYQPVWDPTTTEAGDASSNYKGFIASSFATKTNDTSNVYYTHFQFALHNSGTTSISAYLSSGTDITTKANTPTATGAADALAAARVAIYNGDTLLSYFAHSTDTALNCVQKTTTATDFLYGVKNFKLGTAPTAKTRNIATAAFPAITATGDTDIAGYNTLGTMADNTASSDLTFDVYCWLEGTSAGAIDACKGAEINFTLDVVAL